MAPIPSSVAGILPKGAAILSWRGHSFAGTSAATAGPAAPTAPIEKEGYLEKEGGSVKSWRLRWFVLAGQHLFYYRARGDATPAGVIDLGEATAVRVVAEFVRRRRPEHLFCIVLPHRTFNIIAPDAVTRQQWVDAIAAKLPAANSAVIETAEGKAVPVVAVDGVDEDIVESSDEDDEDNNGKAGAASDDEPDLTPIEQLRARCAQCKAAVENVLFAEPETLLAEVKVLVDASQAVFAAVYEMGVGEGDAARKRILDEYAVAIESSAKQTVSVCKTLAVRQRAGADDVEAARIQLQDVAYEFLAKLDRLIADCSELSMNRPPSIRRLSDSRQHARDSVLRAHSSLDIAFLDLQKLSTPSASRRNSGLAPTATTTLASPTTTVTMSLNGRSAAGDSTADSAEPQSMDRLAEILSVLDQQD